MAVASVFWGRSARWLASALLVLAAVAAWALTPRRAGPQPVAGLSFPVAAFPLALSANKRLLVDRAGVPFLIHGDSAWSLIAQLTREDAEIYLEDRRLRGVNLVMVNLLEHHYADNPPFNAYGQAPFTRTGDFSSLNDAYFAHAEWVVERAAAKHIAVLLCPEYLGYDGGVDGWYEDMLKNGPAILREYGRRIGARFRRFDNVIWLEGGDFRPPALHVELVNAVAEGIKESDPDHLQAAHWSPETSGADVPTSGWLNLNTTYTYADVHLRGLVDHDRSIFLPHFLVESGYEGHEGYPTAKLRAEAYEAVLTGGIGQIFGNPWIWRFDRPNGWRALLRHTWTTALASPGSRSMERVRQLFSGRAWFDLVPDESYRVLVGGQGQRGTKEYTVLGATADGRLAIAYVPTVRAVSIDMSALTRPIQARWYDPTNGSFTPAAGSPFNAATIVSLAPPTKNGEGDEDWVLLLETAGR